MADGHTHVKFLRYGWVFIVPTGIILFLVFAFFSIKYAILYPIFFYTNYFLCEFIDPDADLVGMTTSEGRVMRGTKRYWLGFLGAVFVAYGFIYAYIVGLFGGHRSRASHGFIVGTVGRILFYNAPLFFIFHFFYGYGLSNWGWTSTIGVYASFGMEVWLLPYLSTQFLAWFFGDGIHLILDSKWSRGKLYTPTGNSRRDDG